MYNRLAFLIQLGVFMKAISIFFVMTFFSSTVFSAEMPGELVGKYDVSANCKQESDSMLEVGKADVHGYEWYCKPSKVNGSNGVYILQQNCEAQGETFKQTNKYQLIGNILMVDKTKYFKCGSAATPVKAVSVPGTKITAECSVSPDLGGDSTYLDDKLTKEGTQISNKSFDYVFKVTKRFTLKRGKETLEVLQGQLTGYGGKVIEKQSYTEALSWTCK
jgi:hypothetical protein